MTIYYNTQDRKPLVKAISEFTGADAVYMRTPTYAYQIDYFTVTREGNLEFDDRADSEEIEVLLEFLAERGFTADTAANTAQELTSEELSAAADNAVHGEPVGSRWKFRLKTQRSETSPSCLTRKADLSAEP